jgi:hypothetical protein
MQTGASISGTSITPAPSSSKSNYDQLCRMHRKEIESIRDEWQRETLENMRRQDQQHQRETELLAKISCLEMARDSRAGRGRDPLEDVLYLKDKQIWDSDQRIRNMQDQMRFTTGKTPGPPSTDVSVDIDNAMSFLEAELGSILHGHHLTTTLTIPPQAELRELGSLISSVCDDSEIKFTEAQHLQRWSSKFEPEVIVKTLTLAAIRDWVFHSNFPQPVDNNSWLLPAYRDAIMLQGVCINCLDILIIESNFVSRRLEKSS